MHLFTKLARLAEPLVLRDKIPSLTKLLGQRCLDLRPLLHAFRDGVNKAVIFASGSQLMCSLRN